MLTDSWIISQLISQVCALALLGGALYNGVGIFFKWDANSTSDLQLQLERKTYLISTIVQFVMIFQVVSLLMFLNTVNIHLPSVVKGAMCATGALGANEFGYPTLYIKVGAVLVYATYLFMHQLDESEPEFPLTPLKYWILPLAFLLVGADLVLMILYFANINPDVIATCCSVAFIGSGAKADFLGNGGIDPIIYIGTSSLSFFALIGSVLFIKKKANLLSLWISIVFSISSTLALRYYFVKYIYGLPSHLCLFDIFFGQYYFIGYVIFGAYYITVIAALLKSILALSEGRLKTEHHSLDKILGRIIIVAGTVALAIPLSYWLAWSGEL
ncbi:hypothetical protein R9C00_00510 [Flammeovirgaceae bacterium SG7u.111]|nr:hypothetical protein [Flammeovirgaceae bacterium SG7u.132]WPO35931.1 hypothetical protein R9C00_00510 [Flammeovirgaceae bacterium SG7u.111]